MRFGRWRRVALAAVMMELVAGAACSQAAREPATTPSGFSSLQTRVPGEYLVTLAEGADVKAVVGLYGRFGIKSIQGLGRNVFLVSLTEDPGPVKMEELRGQSVLVKAIQPNFVFRSSGSGKVR